MMLKNSTKMVEVSSNGDRMICHMVKCGRLILAMDLYFLDVLWDRTYCRQCGLCLRYARSKAIKRGEAIETVEID
jgi:Pyruvate/2-oxoacid:ferredoxin oxidoreductase delta subunit